jgi:hypothetical protein
MDAQPARDSLDGMGRDALEHLAERVRQRLGARVTEFRLECHEGCLVLRGRARTYYAKQLAQHAVLQEGVVRLANEIEVRGACPASSEEVGHETQ